MLTLQVLPAGSERYFDGSRPVAIVRDTAADVVVLDVIASRQHGLLRLETGGAWVFADQSKHGTFLDGERVGRPAGDWPTGGSVAQTGNSGWRAWKRASTLA